MRSIMDDIDRSALDQLDLDQDATVYWEGPNRGFTKLSSAIRCVMDEIVKNSSVTPGITIFGSPYFLEIEKIEYIYEHRLTAEESVQHVKQEAKGEVLGERASFDQSEMDRQFEKALRELEDS
jgi:hypothetical protein